MRSGRRAASLVATLPLPGLIPLGALAASAADEPSLLHRIVANRLSVGIRSSLVHLEDTRRYGPDGLDNGNLGVNFLGSLWGLDTRQRPVPLPFLEYRAVSSFGAGVAYEQARARTLDWGSDAHTTTAGDGDVAIHGLQAYLFARGPQWRVTPYGQVGVEHYWSRFYLSPGWATGGPALFGGPDGRVVPRRRRPAGAGRARPARPAAPSFADRGGHRARLSLQEPPPRRGVPRHRAESARVAA